MEFDEVLKHRKSATSYTTEFIEEEKIKKIKEAAKKAPSAGDLEAWNIKTITDQKTKNLLEEAARGQEKVEEADTIIVFFTKTGKYTEKYGERGKNNYSIQDATLAAGYAQLKATDLKLDTCLIGAFHEEKVKKILEKESKPVIMLTLGKQDPEKTEKIEEIP